MTDDFGPECRAELVYRKKQCPFGAAAFSAAIHLSVTSRIYSDMSCIGFYTDDEKILSSRSLDLKTYRFKI